MGAPFAPAPEELIGAGLEIRADLRQIKADEVPGMQNRRNLAEELRAT